MTTLRVFRKTTPLVYTIRLSLLPLAGLSLSAFATQVDIAPGSLDKEDVLTVVGDWLGMRAKTTSSNMLARVTLSAVRIPPNRRDDHSRCAESHPWCHCPGKQRHRQPRSGDELWYSRPDSAPCQPFNRTDGRYSRTVCPLRPATAFTGACLTREYGRHRRGTRRWCGALRAAERGRW